ncbi:sensor histidine kinase [Palleronia abyssalis]|uniref:histidine kinase n=1 Tax=Palleronia abyssalis TaxID=1501240 RepID=A0A2R8BXJ9_9RHOB|nr:sensor histidine kinase [Palleronia abyssalis]SPJ24904.1 putative sensor histidine kinase pdtaS [Palleronia abyssalis]
MAKMQVMEEPAVPRDRDREADHRIGNSLAFLAATMRFESRRISSVEEARLALESAANRLSAIARLHRIMGQIGRGEEVQLLPHLEELSEVLSQSLDIDVFVNGVDIPVPADIAGALAVVISELATNSVKHGHADGGTVVGVTYRVSKAGILIVDVGDNGHGLPDGFDIHDTTGLGMTIVNSTVQRHRGKLTVEHGHGASYRIELPI